MAASFDTFPSLLLQFQNTLLVKLYTLVIEQVLHFLLEFFIIFEPQIEKMLFQRAKTDGSLMTQGLCRGCSIVSHPASFNQFRVLHLFFFILVAGGKFLLSPTLYPPLISVLLLFGKWLISSFNFWDVGYLVTWWRTIQGISSF